MRIGAILCRALVFVAMPLLAAGCATPEPKPAFVAYGTAGTFGYSDTRLADDLYQVTYVTPYIRTATDEAGRAAELAQQKQQAYELALWRAAQLAEKAGYPAMQVENQSNDANVELRSEPDFSPAPTPLYYNYGTGPYYRPYPVYGYPWGYTGYTRRASAIITAQLRVRLLHDVTKDAIDTKTTETQLASRYAKTTYPPTTD